MTYTIDREIWIPRPLPETFDFFSRAENLEQITPPWTQFRILTPLPIQMERDAKIAYQLRVRGIPIRWLTNIERWNPPHDFVDVQIKGPYRLWRHTHTFAAVDGGTSIADHVEYALPFGILGRLVNKLQVSRDVAQIFDYRNQRILELLGGNDSATPPRATPDPSPLK